MVSPLIAHAYCDYDFLKMFLLSHIFPALGLMSLMAIAPLTLPAADDAPVPPPFDAERYRPLWEKSPFTLASAEIIPTANFADEYAIVSMSKVDGRHYVRVMNKTTQQRITVSSENPVDGIEIVEVSPNRNPLEASVRIRMGGQEGIVRYDANLLRTGAAAVPVMPPGAAEAAAQATQQVRSVVPSTGNQPQRPQRRRPIILPRGAN